MIVRNQSDGSVVMITQNDHAKLAGLFAAHWGNERFERPRPYASMVRAAQYHDGGWLRYETNPILDPATGKSPSYQQVPNDAPQLAAYQWAIDMLTEIDSYTGLMVSKHRTGLWQSRYSVIQQPPPGPPRKLSDEIEDFHHAQRNATAHDHRRASTAHEVAMNYNLLQVWDLLSLYICSNEQHKEHMIEPVPTAYQWSGGVLLKLTPTAPATIAIDPFPFDQAPLEAAVVYRQLPPSALMTSILSTPLISARARRRQRSPSSRLIDRAARNTK